VATKHERWDVYVKGSSARIKKGCACEGLVSENPQGRHKKIYLYTSKQRRLLFEYLGLHRTEFPGAGIIGQIEWKRYMSTYLHLQD
jgi:hypothetical protein